MDGRRYVEHNYEANAGTTAPHRTHQHKSDVGDGGLELPAREKFNEIERPIVERLP